MSNHKSFLPLILLITLLQSCSGNVDNDYSYYTVSRSDFRSTIVIEGVVEAVNSTSVVCPDADGIVTFLVEDGTYVKEGDLVCIIEDPLLEADYDELLVSLENAEANKEKVIADLDMQYALLEAQVRSNEADSEIARLDSVQLRYASPNQRRIKELELQRVTINKAKLEKKLEALAIINASEITKVDLNIQRIATRAQTARERIDALTIKAPQAGMAVRPIYRVTGEGKLQEGDAVWTNMALVSLPDMSEMKVIMSASEREYKLINVDDTVMYTFDAMPGNAAWGKIIQKSPVGQQYKRDSRVKFFEIQASVDSMATIPEPGLSANCKILLREIKDTIVVPQIAVFDEDSIKVAYVQTRRGFEMRQVFTGASSARDVVVKAGLSPGDVVSLIRPERSQVKKTVFLPPEEQDNEGDAEEETEEAPQDDMQTDN